MVIIEFLNVNSGFITSIATVVLVVITGWYAYITKRMLKSSEKSLNEQTRPYIIAFISSEDHFIKFSIKNYGHRPALNLKVEFKPSLSEIDKLVAGSNNHTCHEPILNQNFMPPGFEVKTTLMYTPDFVTNNLLVKTFDVTLTYNDTIGNNYSENYILDLEKYIYQKKTIDLSNNYYFNDISKQLKEIKVILKAGMKNK